MKIHIDTNIYSQAMAGNLKAVKILQSVEIIYICTVVIGELISGFKVGHQEYRNRRQLNEFLDSPRVNIVDITENTAEHYSNIFKELKCKGKPVPTNDMWIAASAFEYGSHLATFDKHFKYIPGLMFYS